MALNETCLVHEASPQGIGQPFYGWFAMVFITKKPLKWPCSAEPIKAVETACGKLRSP